MKLDHANLLTDTKIVGGIVLGLMIFTIAICLAAAKHEGALRQACEAKGGDSIQNACIRKGLLLKG